MQEAQVCLAVELVEICRDYYKEVWMEALNLTGVPVTSKWRQAKNVYYPPEIRKAYDRLEWSFIREVLQEARFPSDLIQVIMSCVSSTSSSILFNGGALEPFFLSRGIR